MFHARPGIATASLPDGAALLDMTAGKYFALNKVGEIIWASLRAAPASLETLTAKVATAFKLEPAFCRADIEAFLATMVTAGLVELRAGQGDD